MLQSTNNSIYKVYDSVFGLESMEIYRHDIGENRLINP